MMLVMSVGIVAFLGLLLLGAGVSVVLLATVGLGLCMSGMYGTSVANAGDIFDRYPACMGIFVTMTGIGGAVTPQIVGFVADASGSLRVGFFVLLVAAVLLLVVSAVNAMRLKRRQA